MKTLKSIAETFRQVQKHEQGVRKPGVTAPEKKFVGNTPVSLKGNVPAPTLGTQEFIDDHEIEMLPDANGNGDDVFKATNVKHSVKKEPKHGYTAKNSEAVNEMSAMLPYSKKPFSVPSNLDIYGTMNTADRSVEALHTALRRRFSFQEVMPNPALLQANIEGFSLSDILRKINERIEVLIDRDHTIGHSYFMEVKSMEDLKWVFQDKIIPLLQEYFYGDYGKIGLVLGKGFVEFQEKK